MVTILFLDAEADNLLPMTSRIWVVCTRVGDEERDFQDAEEFKEYVRQVKPVRIVGHNHLGFDLEALRKCWNCDSVGPIQVPWLGCFLCGYLLAESVPQSGSRGGHSLENLGSIVGCPKMDFRAEVIKAGHYPHGAAQKGEEFKQYHQMMVDYCKQDVLSLEKIYHYLLKEVERI